MKPRKTQAFNQINQSVESLALANIKDRQYFLKALVVPRHFKMEGCLVIIVTKLLMPSLNALTSHLEVVAMPSKVIDSFPSEELKITF